MDVSICTQADLDQRYHQKIQQLGWITRAAQTVGWPDVDIDIIPIPISMTGKVHVNFLPDMAKLGISRNRAYLLAKRLAATVVPGLASIWRHAVRQYIMTAQGDG